MWQQMRSKSKIKHNIKKKKKLMKTKFSYYSDQARENAKFNYKVKSKLIVQFDEWTICCCSLVIRWNSNGLFCCCW